MARIIKRPAAKRDLIDHFVFLGENASIDVASRFLQSVNGSLQALAEMPEMGRSRTFRNRRFARVRIWPVNGFERYLIFYRPVEEGIELLRVIHGVRDIARLFSGSS